MKGYILFITLMFLLFLSGCVAPQAIVIEEGRPITELDIERSFFVPSRDGETFLYAERQYNLPIEIATSRISRGTSLQYSPQNNRFTHYQASANKCLPTLPARQTPMSLHVALYPEANNVTVIRYIIHFTEIRIFPTNQPCFTKEDAIGYFKPSIDRIHDLLQS